MVGLLLILITFGGITGQVFDRETRSPLTGVSVFISNLKIGTTTDSNGFYRLDSVPTGEYNVTCSFIGYKTETRIKIRVYNDKYTELNFYLSPLLYQEKAVIVRPNYFGNEELETPGVHSLSFREAYYLPGTFADVQRTIQILPGVTSQDNLNTIVVRGGNPDENLIVLDEMEVPNLNFLPLLGSSGGGICMFDEWLLDELNFYYGVLPVRYGDRISSVLNIKMKPGNPYDFHLDLEPGIAGVTAHVSGPFSKTLTYNLSGTISDAAWFIRWLTDKSPDVREFFRKTGLPEKIFLTSIQGKLRLNPGKYLLDIIGLSGFNDVRINYLPKYSDTLKIINKNLTGNIGLNFYRIYSNGYLLFHLSRSHTSWNWKSLSLLKGVDVKTNNSRDNLTNIKLERVIRNPLAMDFGMNLKIIDFKYKTWSTPDSVFYYTYSPDGRIISRRLVEVRNQSFDERLKSFKAGLYISSKFSITGFDINPGLRFDYFNYTQSRCISPRLVVAHDINFSNLHGKFTAGVAREFQSPQNTILLMSPVNKKLGFYYADVVTAGIHLLPLRDIKFSFEAYLKNYYRYPIQRAYTTPDPDDWSVDYLPVGRIKNRGMELFVQKKFSDKNFFNIATSYMVSRKLDLRNNEWVPGDYDQRYILGVIFGHKIEFSNLKWYQKMKKSKVYKVVKWIPLLNIFTAFLDDEAVYSVSFRYASGRPYTPLTYSREYRRWILEETTPINSERLPGYLRIDLRFNTISGDERIFGKVYHTESFIEFINITNHKNVYSYYWDNENERRIEVTELPFMVNFGVRMRF